MSTNSCFVRLLSKMHSGVAPRDNTLPHIWNFGQCFGRSRTGVSIFFVHFFVKVGYSQTELSSVKKTSSQSRSYCGRSTSLTAFFSFFFLSVSGGAKKRALTPSLNYSAYCERFAGIQQGFFFYFISEMCQSPKSSKTDQLSKPHPVRFIQFPRTPTPSMPSDSSPSPNILDNTIQRRKGNASTFRNLFWTINFFTEFFYKKRVGFDVPLSTDCHRKCRLLSPGEDNSRKLSER